MKILTKAVVLIGLSIGLLYFMEREGLLDFQYVKSAFETGRSWLALVFVIQLSLSFSVLLRYVYLVRLFGIRSSFSHVTAATFVSAAVGQWAPGSLAVTEVLRVGLMIGADKHIENSPNHAKKQKAANKRMKARLAAASLFDRLIGFFVILMMGTAVSLKILLSQSDELPVDKLHGLQILGGASAAGALVIFMLPFVSRMPFVSRILLTGYVLSKRKAAGGKGIVAKLAVIFARLFSQLRNLQLTIIDGSKKARNFVVPVSLSIVSGMMTCLTLYYSSRAIGQEINFLAILSVFPVMAVATLLPIGFAGVGGQQLVAIGLFDIFALSPAQVASASLLQNMVLLAGNTLLGLFFAHLSAAQIKAIVFARREQAKLQQTGS